LPRRRRTSLPKKASNGKKGLVLSKPEDPPQRIVTEQEGTKDDSVELPYSLTGCHLDSGQSQSEPN
jgi:hypothetical protein